MNSPYLHRRIARAYERMMVAKSDAWFERWADAFLELSKRHSNLKVESH